MKSEKKFTNCEYCDKQITIESPPSRLQYEQGLIDISSGTILYSEELAKAKAGSMGLMIPHCGQLAGRYCDKNCLIKHIEELLKD